MWFYIYKKVPFFNDLKNINDIFINEKINEDWENWQDEKENWDEEFIKKKTCNIFYEDTWETYVLLRNPGSLRTPLIKMWTEFKKFKGKIQVTTTIEELINYIDNEYQTNMTTENKIWCFEPFKNFLNEYGYKLLNNWNIIYNQNMWTPIVQTHKNLFFEFWYYMFNMNEYKHDFKIWNIDFFKNLLNSLMNSLDMCKDLKNNKNIDLSNYRYLFFE